MDKVFDKKRKYIGFDGEEYINMSIPVVDIDNISGNSVVRLNQDYNGRIDSFVWREVAQNMDMIDIVMYANHIFNPFSIKSEDLLTIPIDNDRVYVESNEPALPDGKKHSNNINGKKSMTYAERIEYLAKMGLGVK